METTNSFQVWNLKEEGPMCLLLRIETPRLFNSKSCSWKRRILRFTLSHYQNGLVTLESSSNTVIRETTPFSLPTTLISERWYLRRRKRVVVVWWPMKISGVGKRVVQKTFPKRTCEFVNYICLVYLGFGWSLYYF